MPKLLPYCENKCQEKWFGLAVIEKKKNKSIFEEVKSGFLITSRHWNKFCEVTAKYSAEISDMEHLKMKSLCGCFSAFMEDEMHDPCLLVCSYLFSPQKF